MRVDWTVHKLGQPSMHSPTGRALLLLGFTRYEGCRVALVAGGAAARLQSVPRPVVDAEVDAV